MASLHTNPVVSPAGAAQPPSLANRFLLSLWVFSYAALLQVFYLVRWLEGSRSAGKQPAGGM